MEVCFILCVFARCVIRNRYIFGSNCKWARSKLISRCRKCYKYMVWLSCIMFTGHRRILSITGQKKKRSGNCLNWIAIAMFSMVANWMFLFGFCGRNSPSHFFLLRTLYSHLFVFVIIKNSHPVSTMSRARHLLNKVTFLYILSLSIIPSLSTHRSHFPCFSSNFSL